MTQHLLNMLKKIHEKRDNLTGICNNIRIYMEWDEAGKEKFLKLVKAWPKYSGRLYYPVPAPQDMIKQLGDPLTAAEYAYLTARNYWDKRTEYGRLRWELLEWMIQELEKEHGN